MTLPATSVARAATKYAKMSDNEDAHTDTVGANEGKGWLDAATFSWLTPLLRFGKTTPLELKHLPALPPKHSSQRWVQAFEAAWAAAKAPPTAPSGGDAGSKDRVTAQGYRVISAMVAMFRLEIVIITLMTLSTQSCMFARVFVLRALITHLQDGPAANPEGEDDVGGYLAWGILLAILLAACDMGTTSIWYHLYQREEMFAMHVRTALTGAVFNKMLRLTSGTSKGTLIMLTSTDIKRLQSVAYNVFGFVGAPTAIVASLTVCFLYLGVAGVPVLAVAALLAPAVWKTTHMFDNWSEGVTKFQQKRMQQLTEALQSIALVKSFSWEEFVHRTIGETRLQELKFVRAVNYGIATIMTVAWSWGAILSVCGFAAHVLLGRHLDAATAFPVLLVLGEMEWAILHLPDEIGKLSAARISVSRIGEFLQLGEVQSVPEQHVCGTRNVTVPDDAQPAVGGDTGAAIELDSCVFHHPSPAASALFDEDEDDASTGSSNISEASSTASVASGASDSRAVSDEHVVPMMLARDNAGAGAAHTNPLAAHVDGLHCLDVTLSVPAGQLVAVVGPVGAGKSSLLNAILGEMDHREGRKVLHGTVAYVPQEAWIFSATVRDNILAGMPYDEDWYKRVVDACALQADFAQLPASDMSEIGERGVTLSGGQRARVSLARAVYRNADVYLLDDPLSAVDAHVGKWLFQQCIGRRGLLRGKTRVLVTHQLQWLPRMDSVVVLDGGHVHTQGSYEQLLEDGVQFDSLLPVSSDAEQTQRQRHQPGSGVEAESNGCPATDTNNCVADPEPSLAEDRVVATADVQSAAARGKQMLAEDRVRGTVGWDVWVAYFSQLGRGRLMLIVLLALLMHSLDQVPRLLLVQWTQNEDPSRNGSFILSYLGVTAARSVVALSRNVYWFFCAFQASKALHTSMLWSVLRAPMAFFNATPLGRITARFSVDVNVVDVELPDQMNDVIMAGAALVSDLCFVAYAAPIQIALLPMLGVAMYKVVQLYRAARRELSRLGAITRSPIHSHLSEVKDGLATVRALGLQPSSRDTMIARIDTANVATYYRDLTSCWVGFRLQSIACTLCGLVAIAAVVAQVLPPTPLLGGSPQLMGVALSTLLSLSSIVRWFVEQATKGEAELSRVERMLHFIGIPSEAPLHGGPNVTTDDGKPVSKPPASWPHQGRVEFRDVVMRYPRRGSTSPTDSHRTKPALRHVSFACPAGKRTAIVGRTGAGKSSCLQALFRLTELEAGSVVIDGVDAANIGLADLRGAMCIIPQEPVLLTGTIRTNLCNGGSGGGDVSDADLWAALERVGLKPFVASKRLKLEYCISEGGSNLSVGQRQLLCLARALLRHSKVLVMDEATASCDTASDNMIQAAVRDAFQGCTIITIAHRLQTICDYDQVVVMEQGEVVEVGAPGALLDNATGAFSAMVDSTGPASAGWLRATIREHSCSTA